MDKTCTKCKISKDIEEFHKRSDNPGKRHSWCIPCKRAHDKNSYAKPENRKLVRKRNAAKIKRNQEYIISYLSEHPCVDCGEDDIIVLDFDHLKDKQQVICKLIQWGYGLDTIQKEVDKCQVRCANCHRRKTAQQGNHYRFRLRSTARTSVSETENVGSIPAVGAKK